MNTATNMAITTMNTQIAMQAAADADRATAERCNIELMTYQPQSASVQQMHSYSECVQRIYPEHTEKDIFATKLLIAGAIIVAIIGAILGFRSANKNWENFYDKCIWAFIGAFVALVLATILLAICAGIHYIFS